MRLNSESLATLPLEVARPAFDRAAARVGVVHLGVGAFHRAHQAVYTDDAMARGGLDWGVAGVSLRAPDTRDALAPQDDLYTLAVRDASGERLRVVGALLRTLVAPEDPEALLALMASPDVRIVSLTVTEKGYCHDPATGALREDHPDVAHDLANPRSPKSAPGFLVEALARRRAAGVPPFTVLCCDNLPANGKTVKKVLVGYALLRDPELAMHITRDVACPSTMVDRIVPATTDVDRGHVAACLGVTDAWPIMTEPFTQWVIEDDFPLGRPDWRGVEFTDDVAPYELMKLRLLNGAHSSIAYLGCLAGWEFVSTAMADPDLAAHVRALMDDEVTPTLTIPPGFDATRYKDDLIARFNNPALKHRTQQIAMDGTQKLPQRLLGTIRDRLKLDAPIGRLALGVAAWMRYATGLGEEGRAHQVNDPMAAELARRAAEAGDDPAALARAYAAMPEVFGQDLADDPRFMEPVEAALTSLYANGAKATLQRLRMA
jgi:fructuronate reductase